jgi:hypothetical protein
MWLLSVALAAPEPVTLPATGRHEAIFEIPSFGRYAITAESSQGTQVRVLDRMAGLLAERGQPGERDGRAEVFLDRGDVKVVTVSDPAGTGQVTVRVTPWAEPPTPARLPPERKVASTLGDLETRAYWLDLTGAQGQTAIVLEAAGRYLGDLRLWREGSWLVDASPSCARLEPAPGQPWTRCSLSTSLESGLYLVTAYGGQGEPWTEDQQTQPFELQWGWPTLPAAGQLTDTLGPSGFVRYRLPAEATSAHVALPEVAPVRISMSAAARPFVEGHTASITPESRRPTAQVLDPARSPHVVTVTGPPGQPYTLTWFEPSSGSTTLSKPGRYWVGSLSPSDPADIVDPTAVLYRRTTDGRVIRSAAQALPVSSAGRIERRFNLAERTSLLLEVTEAGPYVIWVEGLHAQLLVKPYLLDPGPEPAVPKPQPDELRLELDPGLYLLELWPREPGIATLHIGHDSWAARARRQIGSAPPAVALRPALQLQTVEIEPQGAMTLQLFSAAREPVGLVVRSLPIDPVDGLPITLLPGETLDLPIAPREAGTLTFSTPSGLPLPLQLDGAPPSGKVSVSAGAHTVRLTHTATGPLTGTLRLLPARVQPDAPLPALEPSVLAQLPKFRELGQARALGVELGPEQRQTVKLGVDRSGLWILESTGLLMTEAAVRTRTQTSLLEASANGAGRNFEIAGYLRSGDYQLTVSALSPSEGHAGLRLRQGLVHDGGEIRDATPARVTVPAGSAVRHPVVIAQAGEYRVRHQGQTRLFQCRLEDAQGWPVTDAPQQACSLTVRLEPGTYALVGLPERVDSRRITTVEPAVASRTPRSGHGPFELTLGEPATHVWVEPAEPGADRVPDVWTAVLPAPVRATLSLSAEMVGELQIGEEVVARLAPGEPWEGELPQGPVRVEVRGARRGTGLPYTLALEPGALVAGMTRAVSVPARLPVAVGQAQVYTLGSDGPRDVRARLLDSSGRVVAANDDRPDDWNFRLSALLQPGQYELVVSEVAETGEQDTVRVSMRAPGEVDGGSLGAGESRTVRPGADAVVVRLDDKSPEIVVARASAGENVGVAIEVQDGGTWRALAHGTGRRAVAVARLAKQPVRVRTWSEDVRGGPVELQILELRSRKVGEGAVGSGVDLGKEHAAVEIAGGAGQFALEGDSRGIWVCPEVGAGCALSSDRWASAGEAGLVLVREGGTVQARRVRLQDGLAAVLPLQGSPQRLDVGPQGLAVLEVRGADTQPMARLGDGPVLVAPRAAIALRERGAQPAALWGEGDGRVLLRTLQRADTVSVQDGAHALVLPARSAVTVGLGGTRDVVASLEAGLFVVAPDGRGQWAEPGPVAAHLRAATGPLWVVNPTEQARIAHLDIRPSAGGAALVYGSPHEGLHGARETWSMPVPADQPDSVIEVRGSAEATLVRDDGVVLRGSRLPVGPGGILSLEVEPGPALAWVARPGESGPVREVQESVVLELRAGATAPLRGDAVRLELSPPGPGATSLVAPCPAVATVEIPGGWSRTAVLSGGDRLDLWIADPEKPAIVHLRALAGTVLYGELVSSHASASPTGEGLGPEVLLAPGGSAWFSFRVPRQGQVGLGARAAAERVDAVLHDVAGRELARGLVILQDLAPGEYLLSLSQPAGTAPVRARPAVVGLDPPPTTPPLDVIEQYRALAGETP